jgi:hypothetical protein
MTGFYAKLPYEVAPPPGSSRRKADLVCCRATGAALPDVKLSRATEVLPGPRSQPPGDENRLLEKHAKKYDNKDVRPRERSCAASPTNLCCPHLRKSSTSRVRGSSASAVEVPLPGSTCNCGGDLTSSGLVDSLPMRARSRVFGARHDRAGCRRRDEDSVVRGKLDGASFRPVLCRPSRNRGSNSPGLICGAGPNPETPIRSSLNKRRAGILTPQVILRQCSSRRGKHSMWGLVQLSRPRREAVALRSFYDLGLDLQLTSRRALRASRRPGLKALEISVRGADNMFRCPSPHSQSRPARAVIRARRRDSLGGRGLR